MPRITRQAPSLLPLLILCCVVFGCDRNRGCRSVPPPDEVQNQPAAGGRTVLLLTLDTWRRDTAGFLVDRSPSPTPFLDGLARDSLVATEALAPVPLTAPSHWSMLTGRWPWRDGVRSNGDLPRAGAGPTLQDELGAAGFTTAAFVSAAVIGQRSGFERGFDHFDDFFPKSRGSLTSWTPQRSGPETVAAAVAWLRKVPAGQDLFLWVHLFDPHRPFEAPEALAAKYPGDRHWKRYLAEVEIADRASRQLFEALRAHREGELFWAVASDHGEGMGEHGEQTHGHILHGATMWIPLLLGGPTIEAGERAGLTATVDIRPTLLAALGMPATEADGVDLQSPPDPSRTIPQESLFGLRGFDLAPVFGLRDARLFWESSPRDHLWDWRADPGETRDLASERPAEVKRLAAARATFGMEVDGQNEAVVDPDMQDQLAALGYVTLEERVGSRDVREFVEQGAVKEAQIRALSGSGRFAEAEKALKTFLQEYPGASEMWGEAGFVAASLGDLELAEKRLREAVRLDPLSPQHVLNLGNVLLARRNLKDAEAAYRKTLELNPIDPFALYNLGMMLRDGGQPDEAAGIWRRLLKAHPKHDRRAEVEAWLGSQGGK